MASSSPPPPDTVDAVIRRCAAFLDDALSNPDLRRRALAAARRRVPPSSADPAAIHALEKASQMLEEEIWTSRSPSPGFLSPLRSAEHLLLSVPCLDPSPSSALLLALATSLHHRDADAAASLLELFAIDPSAARNDIAPGVFEDLFAPRLLPVFQWFAARRSAILASRLGNEEGSDGTAAMGTMSLLSRMSGGQAAELRELEGAYEEVIDENTRIFARYLKEVVQGSDEGGRVSSLPPRLVLMRSSLGRGGFTAARKEEMASDEVEFTASNGRYNPAWVGPDQSLEFSVDHCTGREAQAGDAKCAPLYPQRVPLNLITKQRSVRRGHASLGVNSYSGAGFSSDYSSEDSSANSDMEEKNTKLESFPTNSLRFHWDEERSAESTCSSGPAMVSSDSSSTSGKHVPPKDFVCPITNQVFDDPVTLETGQTYERRAIQEWLDRGNSTCPITRHKLQTTQLPKTNYVLKRLIASWQEQFPNSISSPSPREKSSVKSNQNFKISKPSSSLTSVISPTTCTMTSLCLAVTQLSTSQILSESEMAVLQIENFWRESSAEQEIIPILSAPEVVNGFMEILYNSVDPKVLKRAVFLLSELASKEKSVIRTLTAVDPDVDCMVALFKKGLMEAAVLLYQLSPSWERVIELDMVDALMMAITSNEENTFGMFLKPTTSAILLLGEILSGDDDKRVSAVVRNLISKGVIEATLASLKADLVEEKITSIRILLRCIQEDGNCRNEIADKAELGPILECFNMVSDGEQFEMIRFLFELVKLHRRSYNEKLLHIMKDEGTFSTMHTLLNYLQTALQDQIPIVAGLLIQLDLLSEPRKMSMYREEAIDFLVSCLQNSEFPSSQVAAAEVILTLQGTFSLSGKPLARAFLLKHAGMDNSYKSLMRAAKMGHALGEYEGKSEEEKAADEWERKMAFVLASHEFGLLFEALAEGLKSRQPQLFSACLVSATWLVHMLSLLPDTGLRGAARVCLLKQFVSILKSAGDIDDKALAMLALRSFMHDPEGLKDLTIHIKDILKSLRELKKSSSLAYEMLKLFSEGKDSSGEMWNHKELIQVDCSSHGEVLSIICFKDRLYSGHSDGTIKVWSTSGNDFIQIQETREHLKAVTSLAMSQSGQKLYSGSSDKSIRVWSVGDREIQCMEVLDMKDQVHNLVVANTIACFTPQGLGIKVSSWNGSSKIINSNKQVRCTFLSQGKLYCGCNDSSIQEIDLATGILSTIQASGRKFLGKAGPAYALQVRNGLLYAACASIDGAAIKIWNTSNYNFVGSVPCTSEVRCMTVTSELIYLGCKTENVEIWSKDQISRVETLHVYGNGRVQCMAVDDNEELLVIGTSDGKIQAWGL